MIANRLLFIYPLMLMAVWANPTWAQVDSASVEPAPAAGVNTPVNRSDAHGPSDWANREDPSPWKPAFLNLILPVGTGKTVTVVFVPERRLENVSIHIASPSAAVVVEPSQWDVLEKGIPVKLTVLVSPPLSAVPGEHFKAELSVYHTSGKTAPTAQDSPFKPMKGDREVHRHHDRLQIDIAMTANTNPLSDVTVYANATSPDIMSFETNTGYLVSLFGPRDSQGNATGFDELTAAQGSTQSSITFDSTGRPQQVLLSDGHVLEFTWTNTLQAQVEILDANANLIGTVPLTFSAPGIASSGARQSNILEVAKAFSATHPAPRAALAIQPAAVIVPSQTDLTVTVVTSSGDPVSDAIVQGETVSSGLGIGIPLQFTPGSAPGTYLAFYPNDAALTVALSDAQEVCDSVVTQVSDACEAGTQGAGIITQMIEGGCEQVSLQAGQYAPALEGLCITAFGTAELVCEFKEGADAICPGIFALPNLVVSGTITVNLRAAANGASVAASVPESSAATNATATLVLPDVCTTYTPSAAVSPVTWQAVTTWTGEETDTSGNVSPFDGSATATWNFDVANPIGSTVSAAFTACNGVFPTGSGDAAFTTSDDYQGTNSASWTGGILTVVSVATSTTCKSIPGLCDSFNAKNVVTSHYNIATGAFDTSNVQNYTLTFTDAQGNSYSETATGNGGTNGVAAPTQSSAPNPP